MNVPSRGSRRKWVVVAVIGVVLVTAAWLGLRAHFSSSMFSEGYPHGSVGLPPFERVDFNCSSLREPRTSDLVLHLGFDVPFVAFDGSLVIQESSVEVNGLSRTIYVGPFRDEIRISNLCFEATDGGSRLARIGFYFFGPTLYYGFGMGGEKLPLGDEKELDVRFTRYADYMEGNYAIVTRTVRH